jgi:hypothetical protein
MAGRTCRQELVTGLFVPGNRLSSPHRQLGEVDDAQAKFPYGEGHVAMRRNVVPDRPNVSEIATSLIQTNCNSTFICLMSQPPSHELPKRQRTDRWSGRQTLIFILVTSLLLWALIAWLIHVL